MPSTRAIRQRAIAAALVSIWAVTTGSIGQTRSRHSPSPAPAASAAWPSPPPAAPPSPSPAVRPPGVEPPDPVMADRVARYLRLLVDDRATIEAIERARRAVEQAAFPPAPSARPLVSPAPPTPAPSRSPGEGRKRH